MGGGGFERMNGERRRQQGAYGYREHDEPFPWEDSRQERNSREYENQGDWNQAQEYLHSNHDDRESHQPIALDVGRREHAQGFQSQHTESFSSFRREDRNLSELPQRNYDREQHLYAPSTTWKNHTHDPEPLSRRGPFEDREVTGLQQRYEQHDQEVLRDTQHHVYEHHQQHVPHEHDQHQYQQQYHGQPIVNTHQFHTAQQPPQPPHREQHVSCKVPQPSPSMGSVSLGFRGVELPADTAQQVLNSQTHEPSLPVWSPTDATPADPRRRKQNDPKTAPASPLRAVVHPPPSEAPQWHQDQAEMQDTTSHVPDGDPREHSYGKNIVIQPGAVYLGGVGRRGNATVDHCPGSMFSSGIEHCKMEQHHVPAPASDTHMSANRVAVTPRAQPLVAAHPQQEYHPPPLPISMPLGLPLSQGGFPPCQGTHEWQAAQEVRDSHQSIGEGVGRSEDHSNGSCSRVELPRQQHQPKLAESWADGVQLPMCGGQYDEMMHNDTPAPLPVVAPAAKARGQKRSAYARAMLNKRYRAGTGTLAFNLGLDGNLHQTRPSFTEPTDNGGWGIKSHAPLGVPSGQGWGSLSSSAADNLSGNVMAWTCGDGMGTLGNKPHVEMEGEALAYWERPRPGLAADAAHESRRKGDRPTASNDEQKTKAGAHNAIVAEVDDHASSPPSVKGSRLDPRSIHATKLLWGIGDITACFPSLQISETFTHAVASWSLLDTRRIGVMPMICHSLCSGPGSNTGGSGTTTKRDNSLKLGSDSVQHRRMPTDGSSHWEARVIVPYGALPDKAAAGDWANAIRLVLAEVSFDGATLAGLPGGKWDSDLDGGNPIEDDSSLIKTAVRTVRTAAGVDLGSCSTWIKFCELHHDTHTTVVFLCGGGISAIPQDKNGETSGLLLRSMHSLICEGSGQGNDGTTLESGEKAAMGATFEAILCTEFLWGLVSRDWTEVVQESLRVQALAEEEKTKSMNPAGMNAADNLKGALEVHPTIERPDEIRAAFELFDTCGAGRFSWEQLEAILVAGGVRIQLTRNHEVINMGSNKRHNFLSALMCNIPTSIMKAMTPS